MKKIIILSVSLLLLLGAQSVSSSGAPMYIPWDIQFRGDNLTYYTNLSNIVFEIENGVVYLSRNLTSFVEKGTMFTFNISANVSPLTVNSGIKVIIGDDVLLEKSLNSGRYTFQFYALRDYNESEKMVVMLYDFGGKMKVEMEPILMEKPHGGVGEGLFLSGVGISVVFLVLGILAIVMYLLKPTAKKEKRKEKVGKTPTSVPRAMSIKREKSEIDEETVAAITGALSLYLGGRKFRIISVKPSPWKYYGRLKIMRRLK